MKTNKLDIIAILIGIIIFIVSICPTLMKEGFDFKTDFIAISFAASSSVVITLLFIIFFHVEELKRAFELKRKLLKDKKLSEFIDLLIDSYLSVKDREDELFNDRLNEEMDEIKICLSDLKNGYIVFEETERWQNFFLNMIKSLGENDEFKATSLLYIPKWWDTDFGKKILEENKKSVADKKVKVTRLFFIDDNNTTEDLAKEIVRQKEADVIVKVLYMDELYPYQIEDFIVVGEKYVARLELRKGLLRKVHVYNTKVEIARANRLFKELEIKSKFAEELDEFKEYLDTTEIQKKNEF